MSRHSSQLGSGAASALAAGRSGLSLQQIGSLIVLAAGILVLTANVWLGARLLEEQATVSRERAFWILCQPGHTMAERERAFRRLVDGGNKEWRSAQLSELDLEGISLRGADLNGAGFLRANFAQAKLAGAKLNQVTFDFAELTGADLSQAELSEARFYRAVLKEANLRRANLRAAVLQEVKGEKADLMLADLSDADCLMANLGGANLSGANLSGARLEGASLKGANVALARLDGANLKDADFTDSNWWRARGLTASQIELLRKDFAPSEGAVASLKEDYQKWAGQGGNQPSGR